MNKPEYIRRCLTKISHKKWEYFVVSRVIHRLNDFSIEFVTQQLVRLPDGKRALTDLFFPQFGRHLEIDEPYHGGKFSEDALRQRDIVSATKHDVTRIEVNDDQGKEKSLKDFCAEIDAFVDLIRGMKAEQIKNGTFGPWDFSQRYLAKPIIERGYIDVKDNVTFRVQIEAMKCFGFGGKGWQKGAWSINDGTNDWVWFPRLYEHFIWKNEMTDDGQHIYQRARRDNDQHQNYEEALAHNRLTLEQPQDFPKANVIVFAKAKDNLGANLLRYVGTFQRDVETSCAEFIKYDLVRTREMVRA